MSEADIWVMVPDLQQPFRHHAFITHCDADQEFAKDLLRRLENIGFKCLIAKRDFVPGAPVIDNIANAIYTSKKVVMIISNDSLRSEWCKYEMLAAISDSHERNNLSLVPIVMADVKDESLPQPIRFLTFIHMGRERDYFHKLIECLQADNKRWESLMPAGNVAHGLAWSYYFGYLKVLLPGIGERISRTQWWIEDKSCRRMSRKLFLLFPISCRCSDTLCEDDSAIVHAGHLDTIVRNRAGTVGRAYQSTVYKIKDQNNQEWHFVGEYVTSIHTMYEMEMSSGFSGLQTDDKYLQATRFLVTIMNILDRDPLCADGYKILPYKDVDSEGRKFKISDMLLKSIKKEISREVKEEYSEHKEPNPPPQTGHSASAILRRVASDSIDFSRSLLKLFDLNSMCSHTLEMSKDEPIVETDRLGKARSVSRGDSITNFFSDQDSENL